MCKCRGDGCLDTAPGPVESTIAPFQVDPCLSIPSPWGTLSSSPELSQADILLSKVLPHGTRHVVPNLSHPCAFTCQQRQRPSPQGSYSTAPSTEVVSQDTRSQPDRYTATTSLFA
jgi:hypothetical protein